MYKITTAPDQEGSKGDLTGKIIEGHWNNLKNLGINRTERIHRTDRTHRTGKEVEKY